MVQATEICGEGQVSFVDTERQVGFLVNFDGAGDVAIELPGWQCISDDSNKTDER